MVSGWVGGSIECLGWVGGLVGGGSFVVTRVSYFNGAKRNRSPVGGCCNTSRTPQRLPSMVRPFAPKHNGGVVSPGSQLEDCLPSKQQNDRTSPKHKHMSPTLAEATRERGRPRSGARREAW